MRVDKWISNKKSGNISFSPVFTGLNENRKLLNNRHFLNVDKIACFDFVEIRA